MMMHILAETAGTPDTLISGNWLIAVIGALASGIALVIGKRQGLKEATNNVTLQAPVPTVPVREIKLPPSWDAHHALVDRVHVLEVATSELRRESALHYQELIKAGGDRERHISDKLDGIARAIHHRIDELFPPTKPTRTR